MLDVVVSEALHVRIFELRRRLAAAVISANAFENLLDLTQLAAGILQMVVFDCDDDDIGIREIGGPSMTRTLTV